MCALHAAEQLSVRWQGITYPARSVTDGAAYELLHTRSGSGWHESPEPDGYPYRRFVHACEVDQLSGEVPAAPDPPMLAPLSTSVSRDSVHRLSQTAPRHPTERALLRTVRDSAVIRCGTRMLRPITSESVPAHLAGTVVIRGLCYRQYDMAHLRTPARLAALGVVEPFADVAFALRWRAVSPADYTALCAEEFPGLLQMPASHRVGAPILGTGFSHSHDQLIPEYVTADLDDIPLPEHAEILAFLPDGTEVVLFRYLAEHMWAKVAPRRLAGVLSRIPGVDPRQEYHPIRVTGNSRLVGSYAGREVAVSADPPADFRARGAGRTERVEALVRRAVRGRVGGHEVAVLYAEHDHVRVRACRPHPDVVDRLGLRCVERCVYEGWVPAAELSDPYQIEVRYDLPTAPRAATGAA
ncbi:MAG: hypothetical protein ACRDT6_15440 [Micromonosporaceae bacterium]